MVPALAVRSVLNFEFQITNYKLLHAHQIWHRLRISLLSGPQVQRSRRDFVDEWDSQPANSHVDGFDVMLAGVAGKDCHVGQVVRGVTRKLMVVFFSAPRADHATELPLAQAERAQQMPLSAIAFLPQHRRLRRAIAIWASRARVPDSGRYLPGQRL